MIRSEVVGGMSKWRNSGGRAANEAEEEGQPTKEGNVEEEPESVGPEKGHSTAVVCPYG
jgi:hypothetical protein